MSLAKSLCLLGELFILVLIKFIQNGRGNSCIAPFCNKSTYNMLAKHSKYDFIINTNKYIPGTYYVPGTVWDAGNIWKSHCLKCSHTQKLWEQIAVLPRCRFSDWHGSPPPAVNSDSRQSCLTGSYWSCSCILLVAPLKDAYFEDLDHVEERKHDITYKSRTERF